MSTEVEASPEADTAPPSPAPEPVTPSAAPRRRWRWPKLGIQSKLLLMLLATSIISCVVVGVVGYRSGRDALREAAFEQLTFVRNSRARGMVREYTRLENQLAIFTRGKTAIEAIDAFHEGFHELEDSELTAEQDAELQAYYDEVFVANLNEAQSQDVLAPAFYPTDPAQRYLQAHYTAPYDDFDEALAVQNAGDGSVWSASHEEFHPFFSDLVVRFDYEDALLVDDESNVVYTAYKGVDLGTNLAERAVRPDELGRRRGGGARVELRRPRGDHRPRALPAVVRHAHGVGGVADRRRQRGQRRARPAAQHGLHQPDHDRQPGLGRRRPR